MKVIRLVGLFILFGLVIVSWLVSYFLIDRWISQGVEYAGGQVNGATVSLDQAVVNWFSGELSLTELEAADPEQLSQNRVAFAKLDFDVSLLALLKGQLRAEKLTIRDLAVHSKRTLPGEVIDRPSTSDLAEWQYPAAVVSDAKDIDPVDVLNDVDIKSPTLYRKYAEELEKTQQAWSDLRSKLPTKEDLARHKKNYNAAVKSLKEAKGLKKIPAAKQLKQVVSQVKADRRKLEQFQRQVKSDLGNLKSQWSTLQKQVTKDAELAMSVASLSPDGLKHVAATLLGEDMAGWLELAMSNIDLVRDLLPSSDEPQSQPEALPPELRRGRDYSFDQKPLPPDFWIERTEISGALNFQEKVGNVEGTIENIADQLLPGNPLSLSVDFSLPNSSDDNKASVGGIKASLRNVEGESNPGRNPLSGEFFVEHWPLDRWSMAEDSIQLVGVHMSLKSRFSANKTDALIEAQVQLNQFSVVNNNTAGSKVSRQLTKVLANVEDINFDVRLQQKAGDISLTLRSDLDEQLYASIQAELEQQLSATKQKVEQQITQRVAEQKENIEERLSNLAGVESLLSDEIQQLGKYK